MGGPNRNKRSMEGRVPRPSKKQKRQQYHSDSEDEPDAQEFDPINLRDSDDDIHNAQVDDLSQQEGAGADSSSDEEANQKKSKKVPSRRTKKEKPESDEEDSDGSEESDEEDEEDEAGSGDDSDSRVRKGKSKRNDPNAFATSLSKILSTKLSQSKRSDPVLSRSVAAQEAAKAAVDNALEAKARRQMKDEKRVAMEKGNDGAQSWDERVAESRRQKCHGSYLALETDPDRMDIDTGIDDKAREKLAEQIKAMKHGMSFDLAHANATNLVLEEELRTIRRETNGVVAQLQSADYESSLLRYDLGNSKAAYEQARKQNQELNQFLGSLIF